MLTRNCQETLGLLLTTDEFNSRLTIANYSETDGAWKEHFRDSLGKILTLKQNFSITLTIVKDGVVHSQNFFLKGNEILNETWDLLKECDGAKLEFHTKNSTRTWIIVRAYEQTICN